jgi:hypothetical protein
MAHLVPFDFKNATPVGVFALIRSGRDTLDIARSYGVREAVIWNMLGKGDEAREHVLAAERARRRERQLAALRDRCAQTTTAAILGDPLPGRSALDRRNAEVAP